MKPILATVKNDIYQFIKGEQVKVIQYYAVTSSSIYTEVEDGLIVVRKNGELGQIGLNHLIVDFDSI